MKNNSFFYAPAFLVDGGVGILSVAVPLLAIKMGASPFILGFIGFLISLFYLLFTPMFGRLSDKKGPLLFTVTGCILYSICAILFLFTISFFQIFVLMGLMGIGMAMFWPSLEVWIAKASNNLLRSLSFFSVFWCAGISVGSLLSGVLFQIDWRLPFLLIATFCLTTVFFLFKCPRTPAAQIASRETEKVNGHKTPFIYIGWIANFIAWFGIGTLRYLFPKFAVSLNITPLKIGALMFILGAVQSFTYYVLGCTSGWKYRLNFLFCMQVAMCCGFLILYFSSSFLFFLPAFALIGAGMGIAYFSSLYYSLESNYAKGEKIGIHESIVGTGGLFGSLLGGIAAQQFNLRTPFILCVAIILGGMVLENIKKYLDFSDEI